MSNFSFLEAEWPAVGEAAKSAEASVHTDPRTACFYARRALELALEWCFTHDRALSRPYQDTLSALVHEPTFKGTAGEAVFTKARVIVRLGNLAVHGKKPVPKTDGLTVVRELFHVAYWLAHTYARGVRPPPALAFDATLLPKPVSATIVQRSAEQLQQMAEALSAKDASLAAALASSEALEAELARVRAEVAAAKAAAKTISDTHDYSEAETRDAFIDLLLREAGWSLADPRDRELEVDGMPNDTGKGYVDYVLWGDDGKPLGLVEAKHTRRDPRVGERQAELYADCLEARYGQRPVIFMSNGYEHWICDDRRYPKRQVQGFYKKGELELIIQRRSSLRPLAAAEIDQGIVERHYQARAIRRVAETFEQDHERKALVVMATGAGKTRTVIALCDLLVRCNWVKRVLFLADRVALVNQAKKAFVDFLPSASPVNLIEDKGTDGRVFVSTYPTMMGLIDDVSDATGQRRFGVGHFDLIVIDEAHRSVFQKYRAIFDYFDGLLVGLTATPKDEVHKNTYDLFDLEKGVPTDHYGLDEAVRDGFLVPATPISVPLKFQRQGIKYADLSQDEKDQWDELEWDDDGGPPPTEVDAAAVNQWLFNKDTVDKVLEHLMTRGLKVAGGDRLGKTIVFAKNQEHAQFIAERFDANYPHMKGAFARVITFKTEYAQSLIDSFSNKEKSPHIAISVDMLDTGIDVPEIVNLVFFKLVRSKTKFWQMLGRGTRLCRNLFGPGQHKKTFHVFDYCGNLEFFAQDQGSVEPPPTDSLGTLIFRARLELIGTLDDPHRQESPKGVAEDESPEYDNVPRTERHVRRGLADALHRQVAAMHVDNFVVRPKRRTIEKYLQRARWDALNGDDLAELAHEVAGLPSELPAEVEEAKRFDLLLLRLQLAAIKAEPAFTRLRDQVKAIAGLLEEKSAIPAVHDELALIQDLQTDEWWQDVTTPMLETVRRRLRDLVRLIDKRKRKPLYTDFFDELGAESVVELKEFAGADGFERFRFKARAFLMAHADHVTVHKLRLNLPLTASDLEELERILVESGVGRPDQIEEAKATNHGLGLFVRSLVGLDRGAAKEALARFSAGLTLSANQLEFANLIVDHLTEHGMMDAALLYESPFTDIAPTGPEAMFSETQLGMLVDILEHVRRTAQAA